MADMTITNQTNNQYVRPVLAVCRDRHGPGHDRHDDKRVVVPD